MKKLLLLVVVYFVLSACEKPSTCWTCERSITTMYEPTQSGQGVMAPSLWDKDEPYCDKTEDEARSMEKRESTRTEEIMFVPGFGNLKKIQVTTLKCNEQ